MLKIPDRASIAAMRRAEEILGRRVGPSTGTNLAGVLRIARGMLEAGETGSIVSLLCDDGDRYSDTFHDEAWLTQRDLCPE